MTASGPAGPFHPLDTFVALSAELTGFSTTELLSTGQAQAHLDALVAVVGDDVVGALLGAATGILADGGDVHTAMADTIMGDDRLGPVARNVIVQWYLGQWDQLPRAWRDRFGASPADLSTVLSADTYRESLVWRAIGAHPMGAKPQGFGAWARRPPELPMAPTVGR